MEKVLIGGVGNALLGDAGIGPFAIKELQSNYAFGSAVKLVNISARTADVNLLCSGAEAVILIDAVDFGGQPGDIRLFRKTEMPSLFGKPNSEYVLMMQRLYTSTSELLLIGMQGRFNPGLHLSTPVQDCIPHVIDAVLRELLRLGVSCSPRPKDAHQGNWWARIRRSGLMTWG